MRDSRVDSSQVPGVWSGLSDGMAVCVIKIIIMRLICVVRCKWSKFDSPKDNLAIAKVQRTTVGILNLELIYVAWSVMAGKRFMTSNLTT